MASENVSQRNDQDVHELRAELASLKQDVSGLTETLGKISRERVGDGRERARRTAERSRERAGAAMHRVEHGIESHPLTGIATAFGVGFIAGKLLDR